MGKFHDILRKLPRRSLYSSNDSEKVTFQQVAEKSDKPPVHAEKTSKVYVTGTSTNVVTWALLEAIETAKQ